MNIDLNAINQRKQNLETTKQALKNHFIGIDKIIDELMDYIQVWYLMPELLTRPVILNLWGMTGVLSNIDTTSYVTSVSNILSNNDSNHQ